MNQEEKTTPPAPQDAPGEEKKTTKKKRRGRRAYLEDIRPAANGSYVYMGDCYAYDERLNPRSMVILRLWLLAAPMVIACVAGGVISTPFTRDTWYVIAPFGLEFVSIGSIVWAIGRITGNGSILRSYIRRQTYGALPRRCGFAIGSAAAGLIGASVYMILNGTQVTTASGVEDQTAASIVFLALKAVTIVFGVLLWRYANSVFWRESAKKI